MEDLFLICANLLENGEDVVMVTIIDHEGSTPRIAGSKMLVRRNGTIVGTIGGGIFEAGATSIAREVFRDGQSITRIFSFSNNDLVGMDMICGGRAEIFVDLLRSRFPENATVCRKISELKRSHREAYLITKIVTGPESKNLLKLALLTEDKNFAGMPIPEEDRKALQCSRKGHHSLRVEPGKTSYLIETLHPPGTVYLFGAGHISQKVARLTSLLNFHTVVLDDREEYANSERFPEADRIIVPESMEICMEHLSISRNSYLVIVTRGHLYDTAVLAQALRTDACYIGMIGSRKKRDAIYENLRRSGVAEEALARVHSPIGINIEAETPEELAVSIAGELVQVRARYING